MNSVQIPKFDEFLAPILRYCSDGKEHTLSEILDKMVSEFKLTDEQKNALMPNGKNTYLYERFTWALTYLVKAGLLDRTGRGKFIITDQGLSETKNLPDKITYKYLLKFPSFVKFREGKHKKDKEKQALSIIPDEDIDNLFRTWNENLIDSILSHISNIKTSSFKKLIIKLLLALGYGKNYEEMNKVLKETGDQGIEGLISQDRLGFDKIYLQAKILDRDVSVGPREIRDFISALAIKNAQKGIFIITSSFTSDAKETAEKDATHKIVLIDGKELAKLMIEYGIGVKNIKRYDIKELDKDFFESF